MEIIKSIDQSRASKPYEVTEKIRCEACGGTGSDLFTRGDYYPCEECAGKGEFEHTHDLLKEAFYIASERASEKPEVRHIQALIAHFREIVSALIEEPAPSQESITYARKLVDALPSFTGERKPSRSETLEPIASRVQDFKEVS